MGDTHVANRPHARPLYRVIWINSDALIDGAEIIRSADDREAISTARWMVDSRSVELWDRDRFIARFDTKGVEICDEAEELRWAC
ncbi:hypothetical protein ACFQE0_05335 [Methylobacterium komagatae]|uniref:Uncharacterized protein n=1 Tax=Methylobacterium komagatae TaxID=374425 RepID=A0ABW2BFA2_9HYPH